MSGISAKFDPWGPILSVLYEIKDSDFVQTAIANTGIEIDWTPFSKADAYSHGTRIRALRRDISSAYAQIDQDTRGLVARIVVKAILRRHDGYELRVSLRERLEDIGWTIDESGNLVTLDALVSEYFFPASSEYDAYVAIRDVISNAANELIIEDPYIVTSLLMALRTLQSNKVRVRILTVAKHLPADFAAELAAFRKQHPETSVELRSTVEFHDRFIVADENIYHVGASIKDAGKRAFMINLVQDQLKKKGARFRTSRVVSRPGNAVIEEPSARVSDGAQVSRYRLAHGVIFAAFPAEQRQQRSEQRPLLFVAKTARF